MLRISIFLKLTPLDFQSILSRPAGMFRFPCIDPPGIPTTFYSTPWHFPLIFLKLELLIFFGKTQTCLPISSGTLIHDLSQLPYQSGVIAVYLENISLIIFYIIQISFFYQDFDFGI